MYQVAVQLLHLDKINRLSITNQCCCSNSNHCNVEEGDCDMDSYCKAPLMCGNDSCRNYFSSLYADRECTADCCESISSSQGRLQLLSNTININVTVIHQIHQVVPMFHQQQQPEMAHPEPIGAAAQHLTKETRQVVTAIWIHSALEA